MDCPKCIHQQADTREICESCGLVFAKYYQRYPPDGVQPEADYETGVDVVEASSSWRDWILPEQYGDSWLHIFGRALLLFGLFVYSFFLISAGKDTNYAGETFLHLVNLSFHEAGHVFFGILGQFIGSLGGTLGQLIMPLVCCYVFFMRQRNIFATSIAGWWFAENFLDIAPYINDARAGVLPLIGGNFGKHAPYGFHDWEYLLNESGLLQYDTVIAQGSHVLGSMLMIMMLSWGSLLVWKQCTSLR